MDSGSSKQILAEGLTIGIPCFRCAETLDETVASIVAALPAGLRTEIILDDDSHRRGDANHQSRDTVSRMALHNIVDKYSAIGVDIRTSGGNGNSGVSASRNRIMHAARYDKIMYFDSDDRLPKGSQYMANAVRELNKDPLLAFVYPRTEVFGVAKGKPWIPGYDERRILLTGAVVPCITARTQDLIDAGGYNEKPGLHEDQEICIRLLGHFYETGRKPRAMLMKDYYEYRLQNGDGSLMNREGGRSNRLITHFTYLSERNRPMYERHFGTSDPKKLAQTYAWQSAPISAVRFAVNLALGTRDPSSIKRHIRRFAPLGLAKLIK